MMTAPRLLLRHLLAILVFALPLSAVANQNFSGQWTIDSDRSSAIDPWRRIILEIEVQGDAVAITETVTTGRRGHTESYDLRIDREVRVPVEWWTGNRHIGAYMGGDGTQRIRSEWVDEGRTLRTEARFVLATSQGETPVRTYTEYRLSADGEELTVIGTRSSRNQPWVHVFTRS